MTSFSSDSNFSRKFVILAVALPAALSFAACSGSGGSTNNSSGSTVSGTLSTAAVADAGDDPVSRYEAKSAVTDTTISLDCGAKGSFTGTVNTTTGAFSVSGVPTGVPCSFNFVSTTSGENKCQVQFQDSSSYDLNNNAMSTNSATATSSVSLGEITCDSSGNITVSSSSVEGVSTGTTISSSTAFDFTGVWTAAAYDGTLPSGVSTVTNCTSNCNGPAIGDKITLVRFKGVKFTPNSGQCTPAINVSCPTSSGTTDSTKEGYAMSIWGGDYANGIGACGGRTGFTLDEARAYAGLSLDTTAPSISGNTLTYDHYSWSTPSGFGGDTGWTQPWMKTGATSRWSIQDCQPVSVPSTSGAAAKAGHACFAQTQNGSGGTGVYVWSVGLQNAGGCVDSSNNPLMVNNWANITFGSCTNTASTFNSNLNTSSCTYTGSPVAGQASQTFTCSWTGGTFKDIANATTSGSNNGPDFSLPYTMPASTWQGQPATILAQGAACANTVTTETAMKATAAGGGAAGKKAAKELLIRYQCYANKYWESTSNGSGSTSCARNYNFNWSTDNYLNFVIGDDRSMKPQNAFITDRMFYSPDGQWGFLKNKDRQFQSIPTASGSTLCPMENLTELKFNRVNDSKVLVSFTQKTIMVDRSTACQAAVKAALAGGGNLSSDPTGLNNLYRQLQVQRMLFYVTK